MRTSIRCNTIRKLVLNREQTAAVVDALDEERDVRGEEGDWDVAEFLASLIVQIEGKNLTIEVWG